MNKNNPNPISEYYIAYFDILGYKDFFRKTPGNEQQFLNAIHDAISKVKNTVNLFNDSELIEYVAESHIKIKIFSDNFLLCTDVGTNVQKEKIRLIAFMIIVSEIQRNFILRYGLFVRGGITKGKLSFNNDYVFGEGLIEAVNFEESAKHPRIIVSDKINIYLNNNHLYSQEEADRAISIENRSKNGEKVTDDEYVFYQKLLSLVNQEYISQIIAHNIRYKCDDDVVCLSYLYCLDISFFIPMEILKQAYEMVKQIAPGDYNKIPMQFTDIDKILETHKSIVESKLKEYSDYTLIKTDEIKQFDTQESILRKYVWAMVYHNTICGFYNKRQYKINSIANCEKRHMKLMIFITDENSTLN